MARYQGRHRVATPSPARRVRLVAPPAAAAAVAITWGALATADGSPAATGAPAAEIVQPVTAAVSVESGTAPTTGAGAVTAKVDAAAKARAAARSAAVSRANAARTLNQQRATALRSLGITTVAAPYTAPASGTPAAVAAAGTPGASAGYTCPIAGCGGHFTSGFGHRASPGGIGSTDHQGIDLSTPIGTPLRALHGGTVTAVGWYGGQGKRINIDIGGGVTIVYAHMSSWGVTVGQRVEVGQLVGWSGNTGNSTGPHLHLEVHLGGTPVNPVGWLRAHGIAV